MCCNPAALKEFIEQHKPQLSSSGVPIHFWKPLFDKITTQCFDSGDTFALTILEYEQDQGDYLPPLQLQVKAEEGIDHMYTKHIYLVDHAWTFRVEFARKQLLGIDNLRERMARIMGTGGDLEKGALVDKIFEEMWRYVNPYSIANATAVEDRLPFWYVMDEVGCGIRHSDSPNFRMVPFFHIPENACYSLIFPIKNLKFAEVVTRDFAEGSKEEHRKPFLLPWVPSNFESQSFGHVEYSPDYFLSGHSPETLPILNSLRTERKTQYKVFSEYEFVKKYLTDPNFVFVDDEEDADILWYTRHFKDFEELSIVKPHKFVNQFPFEYVLTLKDLLCITCRRKSKSIDGDLEIAPNWLPASFNLKTEVVQFTSYFQNREKLALDNHWIIKPFNLARSLDIHITNNLNCIMRLARIGPKIAQKYIENPVLFNREECGKVKFDIRYVVLLKNVKPLEAYAYKNFFLRFANKSFGLNNLDEYEQHFTVMNYSETVQLKHMLCEEFIGKWELQYPNNSWESIENEIFEMLKEIFECATLEHPPCGISESPQSRAVYAADIMLEWKGHEMRPKILEVNWTPDCKRACEYYPDFYNDIFNLLFRDEENNEVFHKL